MPLVKKIAFDPGYKEMLNDQMFDPRSDFSKSVGGLPIAERYEGLRNFFQKKGIEMHTYDKYKDPRNEADLWLMMDPSPRKYVRILQRRIPPHKVIFFILEPEVVNPWAYRHFGWYKPFHRVFLTWSTDLAKRYPEKIVEFRMPIPFDAAKRGHFLSKQKRNLLLLMYSNKASRVPGELYSLRREIIRYYEVRGDELLDLYGPGWNTEDPNLFGNPSPFYYNLYKGYAQDKGETFSEYWFALCIQNSVPAGVFQYDPFMAMATGTVPVYLPPPNVNEYIPSDTYINYNDFKNLDEMTRYLQSLVGTSKYEEYRKKGWEYLNSEKYRPFTIAQFCEDVYQAIQRWKTYD